MQVLILFIVTEHPAHDAPDVDLEQVVYPA
jgi:hypothetical protein